ncbi:hypothetical protein D3C84_1279850 [compost metagenome]
MFDNIDVNITEDAIGINTSKVIHFLCVPGASFLWTNGVQMIKVINLKAIQV